MLAPDRPFRNLADQAPVMIWMSGLDMGCFYFNDAWLEYRGRTLEQEQGNGWAEGVHPDDMESCVAHYVSCFEARMPFAMNYRLKDATGRYQWILDRGAPHYSAEGNFLGFFGGCATTESHSPAQLNQKLRADLARVADFARDLAHARELLESGQVGSFQIGNSFARSSAEILAAAQMETLAVDMLACRDIPPGARWK